MKYHEYRRLGLPITSSHIESTIKQALRFAVTEHEIDEQTEVDAKANLLLAFVVGRWHQYAKSGFSRDPMQYWTAQSRDLI